MSEENVSEEKADLRVQVLIDNGSDTNKEIRTVVFLQDAEGNTVAEQEATARVRNDKVTPPLVAMALLFMALIIYPALALN